MTARQAAINLIKPYVLRGDDPQWIRSGMMGYACNGTWADLRGDKITVSRLDGEEVNAVFRFKDLYDEIKRGTSQPALF